MQTCTIPNRNKNWRLGLEDKFVLAALLLQISLD